MLSCLHSQKNYECKVGAVSCAQDHSQGNAEGKGNNIDEEVGVEIEQKDQPGKNLEWVQRPSKPVSFCLLLNDLN